jgi:hypothetical protein
MPIIEVFIALNEDGKYDAAPDADVASGRLQDNYLANMVRIVRVPVQISAPTVDDYGSVVEGRNLKVD